MIPLLLSGAPGRMISEIVSAAGGGRFHLLPFALVNAQHDGHLILCGGSQFEGLGPDGREGAPPLPAGTIAVDFSRPDAAVANAEYFCRRGIPFVMGTTGFGRERVEALVKASSVSAVVAPNMAVPIVLVQAAMRDLAKRFPGALEGFSVSIRESHQAAKKDASGTAKALAGDFARLGLPASAEALESVRDPARQEREFYVPPEHLGGHAHHYYEAKSADGTVRLGLSHCIDGRSAYAAGAFRAVEFLSRRTEGGSRGVLFGMEDVLGGA